MNYQTQCGDFGMLNYNSSPVPNDFIFNYTDYTVKTGNANKIRRESNKSIILSSFQIMKLEDKFREKPKLKKLEKKALSKELKLTEKQINNWFIYKRKKEKKKKVANGSVSYTCNTQMNSMVQNHSCFQSNFIQDFQPFATNCTMLVEQTGYQNDLIEGSSMVLYNSPPSTYNLSSSPMFNDSQNNFWQATSSQSDYSDEPTSLETLIPLFEILLPPVIEKNSSQFYIEPSNIVSPQSINPNHESPEYTYQCTYENACTLNNNLINNTQQPQATTEERIDYSDFLQWLDSIQL